MTGWTILHQAAYWMIDQSLLERIRDTGASPLLLAQNYQQMQDGAGTFTPLEISREDINEEEAQREAWRKMYKEVFKLDQTNGTRGGGVPLGQAGSPLPVAEPEPEPLAEGVPPVEPAPVAAGDWKHFTCQASGHVLTASGTNQGASLTMQSKEESPANPLQLWRLTEHGHLICQGGQFCVDIDGKNMAEHARVIMWVVKLPNPAFPPAKNQMWVHAGGGTQQQQQHQHQHQPYVAAC